MESKLPPLIMYDDLCRAVSIFTEDNDDEIYNIISSLEEWRKRWATSELELQNLRKLYTDALKEKNENETKLLHTQRAFEAEMKRRIDAEHKRDYFERQVDAARLLLTNDPHGINDETREKLAFLHSTYLDTNYKDSIQRLATINESSGSIDSSVELSYDRTDDNIDESNHKEVQKEKRSSVRSSHSENKRRPSAPPIKELTPPKKSKISYDTTITIPDKEVRRNYSEPRLTLNKSYSESTNFFSDARDVYSNKNDEIGESIISTDQKCVTPEQLNRYSTISKLVSGSKLGNRRHDFCSKTIIKPETCTPCGKKISFGKSAFRCKECRAVCHIECRDKVPLPCISAVNTPNSRGKMVPGVIADYAPLTSPMIPAIVIHCINEIESRGLKDLGIYRVPGSDKDVKDLKEKFLRGKGVPNLSRIDDIHSICGCVKDFLRSLKEPLIVNSKWNDFVNAAECVDINRMYDAISQLPQPNSDTLAFVILHLQKVAESPACKMPASNLAKIFGPTIVGYSSLDPEPAVMFAETKKQAAVMERLLNIPPDYWKRLIDLENISTEIPETQVNERRLSMGKGKLVHTPLAPRDSIRNIKNGRKSMTFSSPMVL